MGKQRNVCTGILVASPAGACETLAVGVILQAVRELERLAVQGNDGAPWPQGSEKRELLAFFRSRLCRDLADLSGCIDYERLLKHVAEVGRRRPRRAQRLTEVQREVLTALEALGGQARPAEVARATGRNPAVVSHALQELAHKGLVRREVRGPNHVAFVLAKPR